MSPRTAHPPRPRRRTEASLTALTIPIRVQPDDETCGPTCLHAVYRYYGDGIALEQVVSELAMLPGGGTLDVFLANHALERGYRATILTANIQLFDPTWFQTGVDLPDRLRRQSAAKDDRRLNAATDGYLRFLSLGGEVRMPEFTSRLINGYLDRGVPLITGLSSTWLYRTARETYDPARRLVADDDVRGEPCGHFVVICGHDPATREVRVADPYPGNPIAERLVYRVPMSRLLGAIFLGIITYDANLLVIEPDKGPNR